MVGSDIEIKILGRVICPDVGNLPPQVAKELLKWRFDKTVRLLIHATVLIGYHHSVHDEPR